LGLRDSRCWFIKGPSIDLGLIRSGRNRIQGKDLRLVFGKLQKYLSLESDVSGKPLRKKASTYKLWARQSRKRPGASDGGKR
jgi:hypothetical protein